MHHLPRWFPSSWPTRFDRNVCNDYFIVLWRKQRGAVDGGVEASTYFGIKCPSSTWLPKSSHATCTSKQDISETTCLVPVTAFGEPLCNLKTLRLNIAALPSGAVLDHCGPRATAILFASLVAVGCTIFAKGPTNDVAYMVGSLDCKFGTSIL